MRMSSVRLLLTLLALPSFWGRLADAATTELVSVALGGVPADGESTSANMTPDGRWVVFASAAGNLVNADTNVACNLDEDPELESCPDVFLRDRLMQTTTLVSVDSLGAQGDRESANPDISSDGRWIVFESNSSNLVPNDTDSAFNCFLHDTDTGITERVSVSSNGTPGSATSCGVSDDGRFVVFSSTSDNIDPDPFDNYRDVFVRDRELGTTQKLVGLQGENDCPADSFSPDISSDGRFILFDSFEDPFECLSPSRILFLYKRETFEYVRVPLPGEGELFNSGPFGGDFFTFRMRMPTRVYVRNVQGGPSEEVSLSSTGERGNGQSFGGRVTSDGRYVAFTSQADDLVPGDTNDSCSIVQVGNCDDVFVRDRVSDTTERVSLSASGSEGDGASNLRGMTDDGAIVLFLSRATNLVTGDTNDGQDVFVRKPVCGDGALDRGEECDDGNPTGGDGCSATCHLDCPPVPAVGCRQPTEPGKASVQLMDRGPGRKKLQWRWTKGAVTPKSAFGQPTASVAYRLCIYDNSGEVFTAGIPAGGGWKERPWGFSFQSRVGAPDGILAVTLREGLVPGKASVAVRGGGAFLSLSGLATLASPVTVQLTNTLATPECWEAVYSTPFQRQDSTQLKDRSD
jgi:cysteine-rich repeat protein